MMIAVTGGTGFIGQCLLKEYADRHRFRVLCIETDTDSFFPHLNIEYIHSDFSIEDLTDRLFDCDALVHLAGILSTRENESSLTNYWPSVMLSENLFLAASKCHLTNIVNISSRTVYDQYGPSPHLEDEPLKPLNLYAVAKIAVENLADLYNSRHGMEIKSLRFAQVYGSNGRGGYMMEVFRSRCMEKKAIEVLDTQGKELLYVKDAARAVISACEHPHVRGIINIGTGVFLTNREIAETFCRVYHNDAGISFTGDPNEKTIDSHMDVTRAQELLDFRAEYALASALEDMRVMETDGDRRSV